MADYIIQRFRMSIWGSRPGSRQDRDRVGGRPGPPGKAAVARSTQHRDICVSRDAAQHHGASLLVVAVCIASQRTLVRISRNAGLSHGAQPPAKASKPRSLTHETRSNFFYFLCFRLFLGEIADKCQHDMALREVFFFFSFWCRRRARTNPRKGDRWRGTGMCPVDHSQTSHSTRIFRYSTRWHITYHPQ
ncbi:hypothetical protein VTG60DRAFT_6226 [Thermothelomyces hinnuleus]